MNFLKLCRSCMKDLSPLDMELFEKKTFEMFIFITKIQVNMQDGLPNNFCSNCRDQIKAACKFIKQSLEADITFKNIISENEHIIDHNNYHFENKDLINLDGKLEVRENVDYCGNDSNDGDVKLVDSVKDMKIETGVDAHPINISQRCSSIDVDNVKWKKIKCHDVTVKTTADSLILHNYYNVDNNIHNSLDQNETKVITEVELDKHNIQDTQEKPTRLRKRKEIIDNTDFNNTELLEDRQICPICNKEYSGKKDKHWLKKHLKQHSKKIEREKTENGFSFSKINNMTDEKAAKTCPKCKKTFTSQIWFTKHMATHTVNKTYACPFCTKKFVTYAQWRDHKSTHELDRKHVCNVCEKRFRLKKQLAVHSLTHSDERPFICDKCYKAFKLKQVLINHLRVHENLKPFLCSVCGLCFVTAHQLDEHTTVHTRERRHACTKCTFRAGYSSVLRRHMLTHTKTRKYKCGQCEKAFYDSGSLSKHIRTHTGERPYSCPTCGLGLVDSWRRKLHMMRAHQLSLEEVATLRRDGRPRTPLIR